MFRTASQLKDDLGEPVSRYHVNGQEIWCWHCSCLATQVDEEQLHWSPCEHHRPPDWDKFLDDG